MVKIDRYKNFNPINFMIIDIVTSLIADKMILLEIK